jgi:hypothetical protein
MRQLCDNLDVPEQAAGREVRVSTELLRDTGLRPEEIRELPLDCLAQDPDGSPVLVYDNFKSYRLGRRLLIGKPLPTLRRGCGPRYLTGGLARDLGCPACGIVVFPRIEVAPFGGSAPDTGPRHKVSGPARRHRSQR